MSFQKRTVSAVAVLASLAVLFVVALLSEPGTAAGKPQVSVSATKQLKQACRVDRQLCLLRMQRVQQPVKRHAEIRAKKILPHGLHYQRFSSCLPAVKYLFADRKDIKRALYVVHRESHYDPTAISSDDIHLGCGQLSPGMRKAFLQGSWKDPYQNVLAMRRAIDRWGWCHWDIVNFCLPGGEW